MKRIAVLMTCYNRVKTTLECLHKLYINKLPEGFSLDIWLVDDASPDRTGDKVKAEYPQVNVIRGSGKLFWCKGMRLAWEKAASAYDYDGYLWLNDDVMLFSDGLSSLFKDMITIFQSGQECGVVVGTCVERKGGALTYGCYGENGTTRGVNKLVECAPPEDIAVYIHATGKTVKVVLMGGVFIPGCPPRPEAIMYGMMQLQRKVKIEKFFGGANHKQTAAEKELGVSNEELTFRNKLGDHRRERLRVGDGTSGMPIVVTDVPKEFKEELEANSQQPTAKGEEAAV